MEDILLNNEKIEEYKKDSENCIKNNIKKNNNYNLFTFLNIFSFINKNTKKDSIVDKNDSVIESIVDKNVSVIESIVDKKDSVIESIVDKKDSIIESIVDKKDSIIESIVDKKDSIIESIVDKKDNKKNISELFDELSNNCNEKCLKDCKCKNCKCKDNEIKLGCNLCIIS
jgi:dGTP triphosphohydrolase